MTAIASTSANSPGPGPQSSDVVALDALGAQIIGLSGRLAAATCRWLLLIAEFDAQGGHDRFGLISTARWLSHYCGLSRRTAVEHVRVARALHAFPALAQAMSAGRLSYSQARAISRLAHPGEHRLVGDLIEVAATGTVGQLEVMVRGLRTVEHNDGEPVAPTDYLARSWGEDSRWRLNARLAPERGAVIQAAIDQIARTENITAAAALTRMAEIALAALDDTPTAATGKTRYPRGHEHAAIVVHIDEARIPSATTASTGADIPALPRRPRSAERGTSTRARPRPAWAHIEAGPGLPDPVVLRLLCDGSIRTAIRARTGDVLNLGRGRRLVTDRQFRALLLRDGGCAFPGCGSEIGLEAHHVRHWIRGGRTDMANLVLQCRAHHHMHHEGVFTVRPARDPGRFEFRRADGRILPCPADPPVQPHTSVLVEDEHVDVAESAATTDSTGERLDRAWAISVLAHRRSFDPGRAGLKVS